MSAASAVWRLVSGLPRAKRERRRIMAFQVAADDSGSEPRSRTFVLAGFIANAAMWAEFSDEWDRILSEAPRLDYLKISEANNMSEEFAPRKGWTEAMRDARLHALAEVIARFPLMGICVSL